MSKSPKPNREAPLIGPARVEQLTVKNDRAIKSIELKDLTPLTVLRGSNGSGKSTVFAVFSFLAACFQSGLRSGWERRGARELTPSSW